MDWDTLPKKDEKINTMIDTGSDIVKTIKRNVVCLRAQHIIIAMECAEHHRRNTRFRVARFSTLKPSPESAIALEERILWS